MEGKTQEEEEEEEEKEEEKEGGPPGGKGRELDRSSSRRLTGPPNLPALPPFGRPSNLQPPRPPQMGVEAYTLAHPDGAANENEAKTMQVCQECWLGE